MDKNNFLSEQLTIVVNSCDGYEDLWAPFFSLLKKYWDPSGIRILLNTESKTFQMDGLEIECVHSPKENSYGKRMMNALSAVKTKYVLLMLDDFFLRSPVNTEKILQIMTWMEEDADIAYFNCDCNKAYADWEINKYPGYRRLPPGNDYILSMQAAIWRTEKLRQFWKADVSPWEWELICNILTYKDNKTKYYCLMDGKDAFLDYGHYQYGDIWGVFRGKWIKEDVGPLFEKEGIAVDLALRGCYQPDSNNLVSIDAPKRWEECKRIGRCLGVCHFLCSLIFTSIRDFFYWRDIPIDLGDYCGFLAGKAKKRFMSQNIRGERNAKG